MQDRKEDGVLKAGPSLNFWLCLRHMKVLIKNIRTLYQIEDIPKTWVAGDDMASLPALENAYLAIEDGIIVDFGSMDDWPGISDWRDLQVIDASGKFVLPAWCDSHTHLVFAGTREGEFVDRIHGLTYEEIAARGGGILNSAKRLQGASEEQLLAQALVRLKEVERLGTGAIEIKSGYGLTPEAELKMLRVAKALKEHSEVTIKTTFLGAHAYPTEFKDNKQGYLDLVIKEMIPAVAEEGLAEYIDVFCETNYFSVADTEKILDAGIAAGLTPKVHVNQFTSIGGIDACVKRNALSVDHLEVMTPEDVTALKGSTTMPTLLPSCSFFLSIPYGPARALMQEGLPVALATDYNPGSTPSGNIPFVLSLACIKMKMTPEEAINAVTINGAYAMGLSESHGSICVGKKANLILTKEIPSINFIPYAFGSEHIDQVILNGVVTEM